MASATARVVARQVRTLYGVGSAAHLSDGDLLARFAARGDAAAFEALVLRHGPTVLRVCRDVLADPNDADDAFQATFLVLVRRAGFIRKRASVGPWLHGVAYRVASKARVRAARRRSQERRAVEAGRPESSSEPADAAIDRAALHEEIDRLPEPYRAPVVLCYLEGLTHDQAAARLGWPVGTVRGRLARARDRLRDRLRRRGFAPALVLAAPRLPSLDLPARLIRSASEIALSGATPSGTVPAAVVALAEGALNAMTWTKARFLALNLAAVGLLAAGTTLTAGPGDDGVPSAPKSGEATTQSKPRQAPKSREELEAALEQPITWPSSSRMTLGEAIDLLRKTTGLDIIPDHMALHEEGVTLKKLVDLSEVNNVKLKTVLKLMLSQLHLSYHISDGVLLITSANVKQPMVTRVYSVGDLVSSAPVVFSGGQRVYSPKPEFEPLIDLIKSSVAPGTWSNVTAPEWATVPGRDPADSRPITPPDASITPFYLNASLIIRQTPAVHDEVVQRLRQLRRLRGLRIPEEEVEEVRNASRVVPAATQTTLELDRDKQTVSVSGPARLVVKPASDNPPATQATPVSYTFPVADLVPTPSGSAVGTPLKPEQIDAIVRLIAASVAPGTWRDFDEDGQPRATPDPDSVGLIVTSADNLSIRVTHWPDVLPRVRARLDLLRTLDGREPPKFPVAPASASAPPSGDTSPAMPGSAPASASRFQDLGRGDYIIEPPDVLRIELEHKRGGRMTSEFLVHPDGAIHFGSQGRIHVAGLTVIEAKQAIVQHLAKTRPDEDLGLTATAPTGETVRVPDYATTRVSVEVAAYNSKVYYVQGAVPSPGRFPLSGGETVLDALNLAGGLSGKDVHIRLVRPGDPTRTLPVDLDGILQRGDATTNYRLQPGDRLFAYDDSKAEAGGDASPATRSEPPDDANIPGRLDAQDRRLDQIEQKLDRLIDALDASTSRPASAVKP